MERHESRHRRDDHHDKRRHQEHQSSSSSSRRHAESSRPAAAASSRDQDHHQQRNHRHRGHDDDQREHNRRDDRGRDDRRSSGNSRIKNEQNGEDRQRFKREQSRSRSPDTKAKRFRNRNNPKEEDTGNFDWGKATDGPAGSKEAAAGPVEKEKPNFGLSGKLTEDTNKVNGVVIKYAEPQEARKPKRRWRLYPFKGDQALPTLFIHRQSCYLIGRDRKICDIPVDHPSCSKQHAVLQYRLVPYTKEDGTKSQRVRPYVLDMESANGTFVNNQQIDAKKYVELLEKDVVKFGFSSREYVLLHENSKDEEDDDDIDLAAEEAAAAGAAAIKVEAAAAGTKAASRK